MTGPLNVLLAEDSDSDAQLIRIALGRGREIACERVETAKAMREALDRKSWDVVISDWSMPGFGARAALAILQERKLDLPFIIVSGTIDEETAVDAMRAGAHDFVLKDKLERLVPAVERAVREALERAARRQAEAALKESESRFRKLEESGIIGIVISDLGGQVFDANETFLQMVGYDREEMNRGALAWPALIPAEFEPLASHAAEQLRQGEAAAPWETELRRKGGGRVPVVVGAANLDPPRTIAIVADLSQRKDAEKGRLQAEEALRQTEEQLRQAQKMEAVGRLAGGVAHDFNNMISVILGYGELIHAELAENDPMRNDVSEICKAARRAAGLTRQLLMFSRQQPVAPKIIDLHDLLTGMDKMLQRILGEDVDLALVFGKGAGRVKIDPSHLEQVILNLVVNARDAMPTGGKLTIETANIDLDATYALGHLPVVSGPHVMIAVTDTGNGMDAETQKRIFEPFFTTKEVGKGTGLGLSTVFGIVSQSQGSIWVYSEIGQGTTFKIYLPRVDAEADILQPSVAPSTLRGTETVLVVEDEEQVRRIVVDILRRQGYRVIVAQHAGEALLYAEQHSEHIHLLLTDVVMPQMSGPVLAERLLVARPDMKVLCMSGYTDDSVVRHGVLHSGVAFLQKPITPSVLATKVREVLDQPSMPKVH